MRCFLSIGYVCMAIFYLALLGEARLRYMRQKMIAPISKLQFAIKGHNGEDTKLVEVEAKGDLTKWREVIDGIPVYGSVITTRSDAKGNIYRMEGYVTDMTSKVPTKPTVSGPEARDLLKIHWMHEGLTRVYWRNDDSKLFFLQGKNGQAKLVWLASYDVEWKEGATPEQGFGPVPAYIVGLVNAHTGQVEKTWNNRQTAIIPAVVGNEKIGASEVNLEVIKDNSWCHHVDEYRRVKTYTMGNRMYLSDQTVTSFPCEYADEKEWDMYNLTGGYSPRNSAFRHGTQFIDLWRNLVGNEIKPYKTNESYLEFYTHYGFEIENAAFKGYFIIIGDGNTTFYPLTALDVICHEIGHAVTEWHGGQMEYMLESGGINEAYSDMLGETCDMYYNKKTDYLIGADIMRPGKDKAMRDMCNPAKFGGLEHYKQYNKSVDVHYSSGIYNKAWCVLSKTKGWDFVKAFQVFTDANLFLWTVDVTMHCGACHVENAAVDRGLSKSDIRTAFDVVGVDCDKCEESMMY